MHDFLALGEGDANPKVMVNHLIALGLTYSIYNIVKLHDPTQQPLNVHALITTAGISSALGAGCYLPRVSELHLPHSGQPVRVDSETHVCTLVASRSGAALLA